MAVGQLLAAGRAGHGVAEEQDADVKTLVIVNDQPYGSERPYNALFVRASRLSESEELGFHLAYGSAAPLSQVLTPLGLSFQKGPPRRANPTGSCLGGV